MYFLLANCISLVGCLKSQVPCSCEAPQSVPISIKLILDQIFRDRLEKKWLGDWSGVRRTHVQATIQPET